MEAPPGLQLLHSLENSVPGGTSIFMDSFKAVELLKKEHPEDYKILTTVPNTFHYRNADHHLHYNRTTPASYPNGRVMTDDVFSARMIFMTHGRANPQGVKPHDDLLAHFPYLGPPNP